MTDQRVGRHVRIYEWDEVDVDEDLPQVEPVQKEALPTADKKDKKPAEAHRGLGGLLKRKLF